MEEINRESIKPNEEEKEDEEELTEVIDAEEVEENKQTAREEVEPNTLKNLEQEIDRMKKEKEGTYERMLRVQAEFDNYKKRTQKEKLSEQKYKSQDLANELLPAMDNFERALQLEVNEHTEGIIEGITMVYQQLKDALKSQGIEEIETVGKEFDPNLHHAVMQVEDEETESNVITEELQKGYMLNDRVIRPAMVKVNK